MHLYLLSIPQSRGKMTKHLGGIIGYKDKTSSRHLIGFPDGSNLYFYFTCAAALSDGRFTPPSVGWKYDSVVCPKAAGTMALGRCNRCFIWRVSSVGRRCCYFVDLLAQIHIHAINRFGTSTTCSIKRHAVSKLLAPVVPPHLPRLAPPLRIGGTFIMRRFSPHDWVTTRKVLQ